MTPLLTNQQVLRLYRDADADITAKIDQAVQMVQETAIPQSLQANFVLDEGLYVGGVALRGDDIRRHLDSCTAVVVGVCTLGAAIDRAIERLQLTDLSLAYLVDLAASLAVENLAERDCQALKVAAAANGEVCTTRYSCGYGDFDLGHQSDLLRLSGADKAMCLHVNEGGLMYPTKSITYLVGLRPIKKE